ncbi:MAG: hypothetical protein ACKOCC_06595 [Actinomycetota bacterium]
MTISEERRFEMHLALQRVLGDDVANTVMDHLPPSGWNDLVRARDIVEMELRLDGRSDDLETRVTTRIDTLEARLDARIDGMEARFSTHLTILEERIAHLNGRLNVSITVGLGILTAILAIQVQTLLSVASL